MAMNVTAIVRNADIQWTATFVDLNGLPLTPSGALLRLTYYVRGVLTTEQVSMGLAGNVATYVWTSSIADSGNLWWYVAATGSVQAVAQGVITLVVNPANPGN